MPLEVPNLDDRRWADLVEEAVARIPLVAPRWTDHNAHDPGITFIELFAWLAEMQIYQLNRVGDRHREVFGRLAGVRRRPRTPASVDVLVLGAPPAGVTLPAGTQLAPLEGDEIVFETTADVSLTRSRLVGIVVDDGSGPVEQTQANESAGIAFLAFGERAGEGAEIRLAFDSFYPDEEQTIRIAFDVFTADLGVRCGPELPIPADGGGARLAPVAAVWEYRAPGGEWRGLPVGGDDTNVLTRSGTVTLAVPADAEADRGRVWIRLRIERGHYDIEPRLRRVGLNSLPCAQRETVRDELLGRGTGRPDQSFELAKGPVLIPESDPPVIVDVAGEPWQLVTTLEDAGPASRQFLFDAEHRRVSFGNGLNGRVPMPGEDVRARWYQASGGRSGNIARGLQWRLLTAVVPGVTLTNPEPAWGGADLEPLGDMELRARALLNRPQRAVTLRDIERIALGTPDAWVARAKAIPNCPVPEQITVIAVPKVRPGRTGPPAPPSAPFLAAVSRHLQQRRLLCDNLRVVGPIYIEVGVTARLRLAKGAGGQAVVERARHALDRFLTGDPPESASPCPSRWPFGRGVFPSEVYALLDAVAGVDAVSDVVLRARRGGTPVAADASGAIPVPRIGLVFSGPHDLTVESDVRRRG